MIPGKNFLVSFYIHFLAVKHNKYTEGETKMKEIIFKK